MTLPLDNFATVRSDTVPLPFGVAAPLLCYCRVLGRGYSCGQVHARSPVYRRCKGRRASGAACGETWAPPAVEMR
ncbi:hypothetical protein BN1723_013776 [Verticillium longisporum]|uniref:Uncharacterized protein n=1 Tax=Verticillium longisporum TaxID=100787 RepID=A0A0G4LVR6_VERLO|nr:hypothetical protein BN1723_013776 [Verticillium longisporum]